MTDPIVFADSVVALTRQSKLKANPIKNKLPMCRNKHELYLDSLDPVQMLLAYDNGLVVEKMMERIRKSASNGKSQLIGALFIYAGAGAERHNVILDIGTMHAGSDIIKLVIDTRTNASVSGRCVPTERYTTFEFVTMVTRIYQSNELFQQLRHGLELLLGLRVMGYHDPVFGVTSVLAVEWSHPLHVEYAHNEFSTTHSQLIEYVLRRLLDNYILTYKCNTSILEVYADCRQLVDFPLRMGADSFALFECAMQYLQTSGHLAMLSIVVLPGEHYYSVNLRKVL